MSEHQIVIFRAIDRPVSDENMAYMEKQSSRAEITPWSFKNEYHYGDFRGDTVEMLRRGYDLHLHYANFGTRNLAVRLPQGLPNPQARNDYAFEQGLQFVEDKRGPGVCLVLEPCYEPDSLPYLDDVDDLIDRLLSLRGEIIAGDLRPLYLAHLAAATDDYQDPDETVEAPVPVGLNQLTEAQLALAEYYGLDHRMLAAAAQESGPLPNVIDLEARYAQWLSGQSGAQKNAWLAGWMNDPNSEVRADLLASFRKECDIPSWPTTRPNRTIAQLLAAAEKLPAKRKKQAKATSHETKAKRSRK